MIRINEHYTKLKASFLFADIASRVAEFQKNNPEREIIRLGIGDVTEPLPPACVAAFHEGVDEMASSATFRGYGPEQGYPFLREAIAKNDFHSRGANIEADEIFVSDGSKCDTGNFQELFARDITVAIPDPVYPVYLDTNVMAGRTGIHENGRYNGIRYLEGSWENGFIPPLPEDPVDLIYLCFPNNPTGATIDIKGLQAWVDYAHKEGALILYDAAYESFIRDDELPHTIYEIDGAKEVAVEFRSFSKSAGFTGTRCAFTVVPKAARVFDANGQKLLLYDFWKRRHTTKFNGVSYPVQKVAAAVYTPEGQAQTRALVDDYLENARLIVAGMTDLDYDCIGGINAPYIWIRSDADSWRFFDLLLEKAGVVCTPGIGFGRCGEGCIRISAFNSRENVAKALAQIKTALAG